MHDRNKNSAEKRQSRCAVYENIKEVFRKLFHLLFCPKCLEVSKNTWNI